MMVMSVSQSANQSTMMITMNDDDESALAVEPMIMMNDDEDGDDE